jgi:hypothetical protein
MNTVEWTHLSAIADRLGSLKQQAHAAAAADDFETASYFLELDPPAHAVGLADIDARATFPLDGESKTPLS